MRNFKRSFLQFVTTCMLSSALLAILPACFIGSYQPKVPDHLRDSE
jgi:cyclic lactone autoinducer peptide